jgi:hypothetical protein
MSRSLMLRAPLMARFGAEHRIGPTNLQHAFGEQPDDKQNAQYLEKQVHISSPARVFRARNQAAPTTPTHIGTQIIKTSIMLCHPIRPEAASGRQTKRGQRVSGNASGTNRFRPGVRRKPLASSATGRAI